MNAIRIKSKKAAALLLCAVMIIGFLPTKAQAAVYSGDGYTYAYEGIRHS